MKVKTKKGGFIVAAELILIATILVIGLIVGLASVRNATVAELGDIAEAIGALDQSYTFTGIQEGVLGLGAFAAVEGSVYADNIDTGANDEIAILSIVAVEGEDAHNPGNLGTPYNNELVASP